MKSFSISESAAEFIAARVRRGEIKRRGDKIIAARPREVSLFDRICNASHAGRAGHGLGHGRFADMSRGRY